MPLLVNNSINSYGYSMKSRKYQQKRRADQAQQTRQQIVQAAMELHEKLGPAMTSIKAIAERAGVQRLTVYRHFPDEASLFKACTSHWMELHPLPAISDWAGIDQPITLISSVLLDFYQHYRSNERMWTVAYRDVDELEALHEPMAAVDSYLDHIRDELLSASKLKAKDKNRLALTLRHCLRFSTWQSLKAENLTNREMVELVMHWLA
jgi:AcrR family transcriptional regulator